MRNPTSWQTTSAIEYRDQMRSNPTSAELKICRALYEDKRFSDFVFQEAIGSYIVDFYFPKEQIAVEICYGSDYDQERIRNLKSMGVKKVIIIHSSQVWKSAKSCLDKIGSRFFNAVSLSGLSKRSKQRKRRFGLEHCNADAFKNSAKFNKLSSGIKKRTRPGARRKRVGGEIPPR